MEGAKQSAIRAIVIAVLMVTAICGADSQANPLLQSQLSSQINTPTPGFFDACGHLVQGVECVLFRSDHGGLYILQNRGGYKVGSRVRVRGVFQPSCISVCMQGDGCIKNNAIGPCSDCDFNNDGNVNFPDLANVTSRWRQNCNEQNAWCNGADLNSDGFVDFRDVTTLADDWLIDLLPFASTKPRLNEYYTAYANTVEPNATGYSLPLDLSQVVNYSHLDSALRLANAVPTLRENGWALLEYKVYQGEPNDIVKPYESLKSMNVPIFVTSDTLLHLYHIQFDETLKEIEENEFYADIGALTTALLDMALQQYEQSTGDLKEAAKRNVAYLAVAHKLIDPAASAPPLVTGLVTAELSKIEAHEGFKASDIFLYEEDYSQYVPRGHYTRSEILKRYFKTLMWYGRISFLLKGAEPHCPECKALISPYDAKIQTTQAFLLAKAIEDVQIGSRTGRDIWNRMYAVTAFYVGLADDLTPYEYLDVVKRLFGTDYSHAELENQDHMLVLKSELTLLRSPKIFGGTGNVMIAPPITPESLNEVLDKTKGMRFMGQRFIPDSYMFQHLVFPEVGPYLGNADPNPFTWGVTAIGPRRCFPRGLDVMAILGSELASTILIEEGDTDYADYWQKFHDLKKEFDRLSISDWNQNLYWSWLYALRALLQEFGDGFPSFMQTEAWQKKNLNAALASWTELRHDTILYAKQSYTGVATGLPPTPPGYVEPVPEFFGRLLALTKMTREGLTDMNALSPQATTRLQNLEVMLTRLIDIANKQLTNLELSESDNAYLRGFAKSLEQTIAGVDCPCVLTTMVADVHTDGNSGRVLEEGVGYVDLIVVACPHPQGGAFLAAGPVLSYYEFKHPMSDRLTDEAWRQLLASPNKPPRPKWYFEPIRR
jgi:hypothetical protein